jgi:hypothetical protein
MSLAIFLMAGVMLIASPTKSLEFIIESVCAGATGFSIAWRTLHGEKEALQTVFHFDVLARLFKRPERVRKADSAKVPR